MIKNKELELLEESISDAGYLSWWDSMLPDVFQIEFGGVLLYNPPRKENEAPSGKIALRFSELLSVAFLSGKEVPENWYQLMHEDNYSRPTIAYERFSFTDISLIQNIIGEANNIKVYYGETPANVDLFKEIYVLCFWAGEVGVFVCAGNMDIYNHLGAVPFESVENMKDQWWEYWKEYWKVKGTDKEMPKDYACEVTIPLKS